MTFYNNNIHLNSDSKIGINDNLRDLMIGNQTLVENMVKKNRSRLSIVVVKVVRRTAMNKRLRFFFIIMFPTTLNMLISVGNTNSRQKR